MQATITLITFTEVASKLYMLKLYFIFTNPLKYIVENAQKMFEKKSWKQNWPLSTEHMQYIMSGLILGLRPANERLRYKVTPSLIGWTKT